ncbi:unnamed protein product [Mytilus coruscus]|uniref:TRIM71 n=1 Tax=Mytilus coruscus TaxID=42192 RepID=A0A6J8EA36_MYTCO|nr:unnamed protein product [Mytilus coruscus]
MKTTRIKINNHLDNLQQDLMKQLYTMEEKENSIICQLLSSIEKNEKDIAECQRNITNIKQHATDLQDNICDTSDVKNTVTCRNLQGAIQSTFQNESILKNPRGIDVDSDGNVYVVGKISNNVVVISPDGKRYREVLTARDCLSNPTSLHYSGPKNQLLVTNLYNKAHLFNLI